MRRIIFLFVFIALLFQAQAAFAVIRNNPYVCSVTLGDPYYAGCYNGLDPNCCVLNHSGGDQKIASLKTGCSDSLTGAMSFSDTNNDFKLDPTGYDGFIYNPLTGIWQTADNVTMDYYSWWNPNVYEMHLSINNYTLPLWTTPDNGASFRNASYSFGIAYYPKSKSMEYDWFYCNSAIIQAYNQEQPSINENSWLNTLQKVSHDESDLNSSINQSITLPNINYKYIGGFKYNGDSFLDEYIDPNCGSFYPQCSYQSLYTSLWATNPGLNQSVFTGIPVKSINFKLAADDYCPNPDPDPLKNICCSKDKCYSQNTIHENDLTLFTRPDPLPPPPPPPPPPPIPVCDCWKNSFTASQGTFSNRINLDWDFGWTGNHVLHVVPVEQPPPWFISYEKIYSWAELNIACGTTKKYDISCRNTNGEWCTGGHAEGHTTPCVTLSGKLFLDTNGNGEKDGSESYYTSVQGSISIKTQQNPAYLETLLLSGSNADFSFPSGLIKNNSATIISSWINSGGYKFTGYTFSADGVATTEKYNNGSLSIGLTPTLGMVNTLNIGVLPFPSFWFQGKFGDIHADNGGIQSNIPSTALDNYLLSGGVVTSADEDSGSINVGTNGGEIQSPNSWFMEKYTSFPKLPSYNLLKNQAGNRVNTGFDCSSGLPTDSKVYECMYTLPLIGQDLTISAIDNFSGKKTVFVPGNLYINGNITGSGENDGLVLIVKKDVIVNPSVTRIDAFIILEGTFNDGTNPLNDNILTVNGGLIQINNSGGINLVRKHSPDSSPSEIFNYEPKYIPLFEKAIGSPKTLWQEVPG